MDEAVDSPQRDLLIIDGKPIAVTKLDAVHGAIHIAAPLCGCRTVV